MRSFDAGHSQPLRSEDRATSGCDGGHDTDGFQYDVPGDGRGALRPGLARVNGLVSEGSSAQPDSGALLRGRERTSGSRLADGSLVGEPRSASRDSRLGFGKAVPPGGYAWWYVDGISHDGQYGITLIAFVGSVFSPYYFYSGRGDPENHCSFNVCLYGRRGRRWTMTERGRSAVSRDETSFHVGPSSMSWNGTALTFNIHEIATPLPLPVRGKVMLHPQAMTPGPLLLDPAGRHRWWPVAPCSRIEVELERPSVSWSGSGYFDINHGDEPLEDGFGYWNWARVNLDGGRRAAMLYDVTDRGGEKRSLALETDSQGQITEIEQPQTAELSRTAWQIKRATRADGDVSIRSTLEDTPFYARSLLSTTILGQQAPAMHETLSLDRFRTRWVKSLLPFRMPRRTSAA